MQENKESKGGQSRRGFLTGLFTGVAGAAVMLTIPRKAKKVNAKPLEKSVKPILYRRTEEVERYYKTLYYQ